MYTNSPNEVDMTMTDSLVEPAKQIHMQSSTASIQCTYGSFEIKAFFLQIVGFKSVCIAVFAIGRQT